MYSDSSCEDEYLVSTSAMYVPTAPEGGWPEEGATYTYYAKFVPIAYEVALEKVDAADGTTPLPGASFVLSRTDGGGTTTYYSYDETSGVSWVADEGDATPVVTGDGITGALGAATLYSLTTGYTYALTETVAPSGYNLLGESIAFAISGGKVVDAVYGGDESSSVVAASDDDKTIIVKNAAGAVLPSTGGIGILPCVLADLALCVGAGALLVRRRRA